MPAEVLDLISNFIMEVDNSSPRLLEPNLHQKVQSLQNLRYTFRQMVPLLPPSLNSVLTCDSTITPSRESISSPFYMLNVYEIVTNTVLELYYPLSSNHRPRYLTLCMPSHTMAPSPSCPPRNKIH
jgi:hypothetical protein